MFKKKRTISNAGFDEMLKNKGYHRQDTENTVIEKYTKKFINKMKMKIKKTSAWEAENAEKEIKLKG